MRAHTALGLSLIVPAYPAAWIFFGLLLGCVSHLVLDGFNQTRQWWLWPFSLQGFRWPLHATVQRSDAVAALLLTLVVLGLVWHLGPALVFGRPGLTR